MKKIITSNISSSVGLPLLGRTIDFIQDNVKEQSVALAYSSLNNSDDSLPIVLYGCVGTYTTVSFYNDTFTITKGAILYQGEIYQVPAMVTVRASISEMIVFRIDTSNFQSGEPTLYTDGTSINTNQDRIIKPYSGLTGTGIVNQDALKYLNRSVIDSLTGVIGGIYNNVSVTNCTLNDYSFTGIKKGNLITITGFVDITHTLGSPKPEITLAPNREWESKNAYTAPVTLLNLTSNVASITTINFNTVSYEIPMLNTVTNGNRYVYYFNFTYEAKFIG